MRRAKPMLSLVVRSSVWCWRGSHSKTCSTKFKMTSRGHYERERDKEEKAKEKEAKLLEEASENFHQKPLTNFKIDELRIMRTIGTGSFGRVKMVQNALTGQVLP